MNKDDEFEYVLRRATVCAHDKGYFPHVTSLLLVTIIEFSIIILSIGTDRAAQIMSTLIRCRVLISLHCLPLFQQILDIDNLLNELTENLTFRCRNINLFIPAFLKWIFPFLNLEYKMLIGISVDYQKQNGKQCRS